MEQDLSAVGHEPLPSLEASIGGVASEEVGAHDHTTNKSMAMDLTLGVESVPLEPNLAAFQQVLFVERVVCVMCCQKHTCTNCPQLLVCCQIWKLESTNPIGSLN